MADITSNKKRTSGLGKVRASFSAGIIIGPTIGGLLSFIGFWAAGLLAMTLTLINLIFAYFFLPETVPKDRMQKKPIFKKTGNKLEHLKNAFKDPVIPFLLITFFVVNYAFSAIPILVPYVSNEFFGFTEFDLSLVFVFIGTLQFIIQGFLMENLSKVVGEIRLIIGGIIMLSLAILLMPYLPHIVLFYVLISFISTGSGFMRTAVPGLISKITYEEEQGKYMELAQSAASLALVPGPLVAGIIYEYISFEAPFIFSSILVFLTIVIIIKVYLELKKSETS
jgi:predicted MFS family arabinose efflux permease